MHARIERRRFLDTLLPLPDDLAQKILQHARAKNDYADSGWVNFAEVDLYNPFVNTANKIIDYVKVVDPGLHAQQRVAGKWVNTHKSAPASENPHSLRVVPDASFVPAANSESIAEMAANLEETIQTVTGANTNSDKADAAEDETTEQIIITPPTQWWLQVLTVAEVKVLNKPKTSTSGETSTAASATRSKRKRETVYSDRTIPQLGTYARQIFMEQLDRCFAFGLTLHSDQLWVYLFDRSGIVGITEGIDINRNPQDFIHVIASLAYLSPIQLGWDPTFQAWDGEKPVPSYNLPLGTLKDYSSAYEIPWVIESPKDLVKYVSIRSLQLTSAQVLYGRANILLEVVSLSDWQAKNVEAVIMVMKQSWQRLPGLENDGGIILDNSLNSSKPDTHDPPEDLERLHRTLTSDLSEEPYEAYILRIAGLDHDSSRLHKYGFVEFDGHLVDTFNFIRKGLKESLEPPPAGQGNTSNSSRVPDSKIFDPQSTRWDQIKIDSSLPTDEPSQPVNRTLTRMFVKLAGWTIKQFLDREELIAGLKGAVEEHEKLYRSGVIHRDVSTGNIILSGTDDGMKGHLIDFDHSKITVQFKAFASTDSEGTRTQERPEPELGYGDTAMRFAQNVCQNMCDDSVIQLAQKAYGAAGYSYLLNVCSAGVMAPTNPSIFTLQDLGWDGAPYPIPYFLNRQPGHGYITGTPPFMSSQLDGVTPHTAIHDMESFLWVLVYITLRFDGPGRPGKLSDKQQGILYRCFYNAQTARDAKRWAFANPTRFKAEIIDNMAEYFSDLKPLVRKWYAVLGLAWRYRNGIEYHYPHKIILKLLDEAAAELGQIDEGHLEMTENEKVERQKYWDRAKTAIRNWRTVDALQKDENRRSSAKTSLEPPPSSHPMEKRARHQ